MAGAESPSDDSRPTIAQVMLGDAIAAFRDKADYSLIYQSDGYLEHVASNAGFPIELPATDSGDRAVTRQEGKVFSLIARATKGAESRKAKVARLTLLLDQMTDPGEN